MPVESSTASKTKKIEVLEFRSLRNDWYTLNSVVPRAIRNSISGKRIYIFQGFPRQWLPIFQCYGVKWSETSKPTIFIPFYSDLSERSIFRETKRAQKNGSLRALAESISVYDSVIADCMYIVDHTRLISEAAVECDRLAICKQQNGKRSLALNSWQGYGRACIRNLERLALSSNNQSSRAVVLPCALTRPYNKSKTHHKLYELLSSIQEPIENLHRIVITSLGVIPEELWSFPEVLAYDSGVPDIYRILRLARAYFKVHKYTEVLDCSQFPPYSDILQIVKREGGIKRLTKIPVPKKRTFFVRA